MIGGGNRGGNYGLLSPHSFVIDNQDENHYNHDNRRYCNRKDNLSYSSSKIHNSRLLASMLKMETGLSFCSTQAYSIYLILKN